MCSLALSSYSRLCLFFLAFLIYVHYALCRHESDNGDWAAYNIDGHIVAHIRADPLGGEGENCLALAGERRSVGCLVVGAIIRPLESAKSGLDGP